MGGTPLISARKGMANSGNHPVPLALLGGRIIDQYAVYEPTGEITAVIPNRIVAEAGHDEKVMRHTFVHDVGWRMLFC